MAETPQRLTLNIEDAAKLLGISKNSAYEAAKRGELPVIRIGARLLVSKAGLEKMLADAYGEVSHERQ